MHGTGRISRGHLLRAWTDSSAAHGGSDIPAAARREGSSSSSSECNRGVQEQNKSSLLRRVLKSTLKIIVFSERGPYYFLLQQYVCLKFVLKVQ